ncbi:hypothetical protein Dimus_013466 [Dionaea muscipula]
MNDSASDDEAQVKAAMTVGIPPPVSSSKSMARSVTREMSRLEIGVAPVLMMTLGDVITASGRCNTCFGLGCDEDLLNRGDDLRRTAISCVGSTRFQKDDPILIMVDEKILKRRHNRWGDLNDIKPGPQAKKLAESMSNLLDDWSSQTTQCK